MVALKGVPALLSPELLYALARMGHGDEIGERGAEPQGIKGWERAEATAAPSGRGCVQEPRPLLSLELRESSLSLPSSNSLHLYFPGPLVPQASPHHTFLSSLPWTCNLPPPRALG